MQKNFWQANLLLLITALIWGSTFIIVKESLKTLHPMQIIAYRFTLAFFFIFLLYHRAFFQNWRSSLLPGIGLGLILALGFTTQTIGLKLTSPSSSALITGLNALIVALLESLINKKKLSRSSLLGILTATIGLTFITWSGQPRLELGDLLTLVCAVFFALHIVATNKALINCDPRTLIVIQYAVVALVCWCFVPTKLLSNNYEVKIWFSLLYLGLLATGLAFLFQTLAQRRASPIHTAIILATEPAFASILSIGFGYEPFTLKLITGGVLMIVGMILSSTGESFKKLPGKII
ncbi:MAG TPA: hypothetical protein DDZ91_10075 [Firmicutes bacterium]|nr:hypothetical protein [Bacillota bacterium]